MKNFAKCGQNRTNESPSAANWLCFPPKKSKEITIVLILTEVAWKLVKHYKHFKKKKKQLVRLAN